MSKIEFVLDMLELMGKVRVGDVSLAASMFDRLDSNEDGLVSSQEMALMLAMKQQEQAERQKEQAMTPY
jgi:Ca2+-binding EF-hand superfamily protein